MVGRLECELIYVLTGFGGGVGADCISDRRYGAGIVQGLKLFYVAVKGRSEGELIGVFFSLCRVVCHISYSFHGGFVDANGVNEVDVVGRLK